MLTSMEQNNLKGCILLCIFWNDDPSFGKSVDLIVTEENSRWLIMQLCIVKQFSDHCNGYDFESVLFFTR